MPDKRTHRGPHPQDAALFAPEHWPTLRMATSDLCWLLSRGYALPSSLKLVGDRYGLTERQRLGVSRCVCSQEALERRRQHRLEPQHLIGEELWLDGYNVLTTLEAALAGGIILAARDGCYRDMASMHGSYRKVEETLPAIRLLGSLLAELEAGPCLWLLDRPVSNSGRLKELLLDLGSQQHWNWQVELLPDPDPVLARTRHVVASSDSGVLDQCQRWFNLARLAVVERVPQAYVVDLSCDAP